MSSSRPNDSESRSARCISDAKSTGDWSAAQTRQRWACDDCPRAPPAPTSGMTATATRKTRFDNRTFCETRAALTAAFTRITTGAPDFAHRGSDLVRFPPPPTRPRREVRPTTHASASVARRHVAREPGPAEPVAQGGAIVRFADGQIVEWNLPTEARCRSLRWPHPEFDWIWRPRLPTGTAPSTADLRMRPPARILAAVAAARSMAGLLASSSPRRRRSARAGQAVMRRAFTGLGWSRWTCRSSASSTSPAAPFGWG